MRVSSIALSALLALLLTASLVPALPLVKRLQQHQLRHQQQQQLQSAASTKAWTLPGNFAGANQFAGVNFYVHSFGDGLAQAATNAGFIGAVKAMLSGGGDFDTMHGTLAGLRGAKASMLTTSGRTQVPFQGAAYKNWFDATLVCARGEERKYDTHWGLLWARVSVRVTEADGTSHDKKLMWLGAADNNGKNAAVQPGMHTEARLIAAIDNFLAQLTSGVGNAAFGVKSIVLATLEPIFVLQFFPCGAADKDCDSAIANFDARHRCQSMVTYQGK